MKCKRCLWGHSGGVSNNITRLQQHYVRKHGAMGEREPDEDHEGFDDDSRSSMGPESEASGSSQGSSKKPRLVQSSLYAYGDRGFQNWQKEMADERLTRLS